EYLDQQRESAIDRFCLAQQVASHRFNQFGERLALERAVVDHADTLSQVGKLPAFADIAFRQHSSHDAFKISAAPYLVLVHRLERVWVEFHFDDFLYIVTIT